MILLQLSFQHKVGILYCKAGQSTEEEMYNNENAGPALDEFLDLLGQRVRLKGFTKYRAQLDNKSMSLSTNTLTLSCFKRFAQFDFSFLKLNKESKTHYRLNIGNSCNTLI